MLIDFTRDNQHLLNMYSDPFVLSRVLTDRCNVSSLVNIRDDVIYVVGIVDGVQIGIAEFHIKSNSSAELHGAVLPKYIDHSRLFLNEAIELMLNTYPLLHSITNITPTKFQSVINYISKCGFVNVGRLYKYVTIDDVQYDVIIQQRLR